MRASFVPILSLIIFLSFSCRKNFENSSGDSNLFASHQPATESFKVIAPSKKTYLKSDRISLELQHPFTVKVEGTPRIGMTIGNSQVFANYTSGSGSKRITFSYVVQEGDLDLNGVNFSNTIDLNGGSIKYSKNPSKNNDPSTSDVDVNISIETTNIKDLLVDAIAPDISINQTSILPGLYLGDNIIQVFALFSEPVIVSGHPQLELGIGSKTVKASYSTGSGSNMIVFRYTVKAGDLDANGVAINSIELGNAKITDQSGNDANLSFSTTITSALVDGDTAHVINYQLPADGIYAPGQPIEFQLIFSKSVNVSNGTPTVDIDLTETSQLATYTAGSGTNTLTFSYTPITGDFDHDGIKIGNKIKLNGSKILDSNLKNIYTTITPPLTPKVLVDGQIPKVLTIAPPQENTYTVGQELLFRLSFNVPVSVSGIPRLGVLLQSHAPTLVYADYSYGTGTKNLFFRYVVKANEQDLDGINLYSFIDLNGGTILGANQVNADLNITSQIASTNTSAIKVDALTPFVVSITPPSNGSYMTGNNLDFILHFNEAVSITGSPRLSIILNTGTVYPSYLSGSGSSNITFRYSVTNSDIDTDGMMLGSSIDLNSGTIQDGVLNHASINLTGVTPTLNELTINSDAPIFEWSISSNLVDSYDFGVVTFPASGNQFFTITNQGTAATTQSFSITMANGVSCSQFMIGTDNCSGNVIAVGESCSIELIYSAKRNSNQTHTCSATADDSSFTLNPGFTMTLTGTSD